jgi:hypothetical protein
LTHIIFTKICGAEGENAKQGDKNSVEMQRRIRFYKLQFDQQDGKDIKCFSL